MLHRTLLFSLELLLQEVSEFTMFFACVFCDSKVNHLCACWRVSIKLETVGIFFGCYLSGEIGKRSLCALNLSEFRIFV